MSISLRWPLALLLGLLFAGHGMAQGTTSSPEWRAEKCRRYSAAWDKIRMGRGTAGLSVGFLTRHAAFIASGCTTEADVCPRSAAELDVANTLVVMAMGDGMASTFLPFSCRHDRP